MLQDSPACYACGAEAVVVDHVVPLRLGGDDAAENLVPLCAGCHQAKSGRERVAQVGRGDTDASEAGRVTLVCGPPGAGKTHWVRQHARPGDLVLDLDALGAALTLDGDPHATPAAVLPFALEARDAVLARLRRRHDVRHAWVILGGATRHERQVVRAACPEVRVVMLRAGEEECMRHILADPTRRERAERWRPLVRRWWARYEADL